MKNAYEHWSGVPRDNLHTSLLVPQSAIDGWSIYCSCGEFSAFKDFWQHKNKDDLLKSLKAEHELHRAKYLACNEVSQNAG